MLLVAIGALPLACGQAASSDIPRADSYGASEDALSTAPSLGTAKAFAVLGASTVTSTGATTVLGDLGVSPGLAITGFPPGIVTGGTTHSGGAVAAQAQNDVTTAYDELQGDVCETPLTGQDLGGLTVTKGVYCFTSSAQLTGTLTLDAQGDPDAVFIFQIGTALTTANNAAVVMINGGQKCNVFWQVGSSATIGAGSSFTGNILAFASITLASGATMEGRALARTGAVTMDTNYVGTSNCDATACQSSDWVTGDLVAAGGTTPIDVSFKLAASVVNGVPKGNFRYADTQAHVKLRATSITSYAVTGPASRLIQGQADVAGVPGFTFSLDVTDGGPIDSFSLLVSNGYSASSSLPADNIQLDVTTCP